MKKNKWDEDGAEEGNRNVGEDRDEEHGEDNEGGNS